MPRITRSTEIKRLGFFKCKNDGPSFCSGQNKVAVITTRPFKWGSCKVGFHCILTISKAGSMADLTQICGVFLKIDYKVNIFSKLNSGNYFKQTSNLVKGTAGFKINFRQEKSFST